MKTKEESTQKTQTAYQCPMKCEGDKTFDQPGNCKVCNMKLVPLDDTKSSQGKHHGCC